METLQAWAEKGPFTLALSSSFFGFFAHAGVISVLENHQIEPAKYAGSSAGALVAALLASGLKSEDLERLFFSMKREDYWDPGFGPGLLKGKKFFEIADRHCATSFSMTSKPVEIAVFDLLSLKTRFLSEGSLAQAVVASCAVPGMFHPVLEKRKIFYDGGILNKAGVPPHARTDRLLNIYIDGGGLSNLVDWKWTSSRLGPDQRILRLKGLPRVHPLTFGNSREAFDEAKKRTAKVLSRKFDRKVLEA